MPAFSTIALSVGALASAGSTLAASSAQGDAADRATEAQLQATRESIAAQKEQNARAEALLREFAGQAREDLAPIREAQQRAITGLEGLTDPNSEIYGQQRDQATQAIQRQLAAQGLLRSGQQGNQLQNLELGLAQQRANILGSLAGTGATQATAGISSQLGGGLAGLAQGLGQQIGSSFQQQGQLNANNFIAQGNNTANTIGGIAGAFNGALGGISSAYAGQQQADLLNAILGKGGGGGGGIGAGGLTTLMNSKIGSLA